MGTIFIADFRLPIADLDLITGGCSLVPNGHELYLERENQDLKDPALSSNWKSAMP